MLVSMSELREKVIRGLECVICPNKFCGDCSYFIRNENDPDTGWCNRDAIYKDAITLLKAQEAQPPKHRHEEYPEHDWEREKDGSIDEFAMEVGYHNGPECKRCGKTFCIHCEPNGYITHRPCIIDEDYCPRCGRHIFRSWGTALSFCESCGQAVKWG